MGGVRRLLRILFNAATALSLAICVCVAYFWATSYLLGWEGLWERLDDDELGRSVFYAEASGGGIALGYRRLRVAPNASPGFVSRYRSTMNPPPERHLRRTHGNDYPSPARPGRWWFAQRTASDPPFDLAGALVVAPCWALFLLSAALPGLWLFLRVRRRRRVLKQGICLSCGYDLRATPDRCPECGAIPREGRAPAPEGGRR